MAARKRRTGDVPSTGPREPVPVVPDGTSKSEKGIDAKDAGNMSSFLKRQPVWILLAVASGACAAINGVFAKLTTTSLTASFASQLSSVLGLEPDSNTVNLGLRGTFFGLNLLFNGIMWALFTAALTKGSSTTRVSIINVSANFFITAMLGWAIFDEKLPLGWWMGAALLAAGNVVIGRREEGDGKVVDSAVHEEEQGIGQSIDLTQDDLIDLDHLPSDGPGGAQAFK